MPGGSGPHFIAALQRRFRNDPAGDIVYPFHSDAGGVVQPVRSTVLTGAAGTVIALVGTDPLIRATTSGEGRAVHFGTLEYLRADRFGFLMGVDDLFWRSLVWAARKPFVVRGYPRLWAIQMDDTLSGWSARVRDLYNPTLTGPVAADGTGGPWRVTGFVFTNNVAPGSADRASVIADINAGSLQVSPHARGESYGDIYWETQSTEPHDESTWFQTVTDVQAWMRGNGGADAIPFLSRSMVPHFWNLSDVTGSDLWNALGFRYITEIQRPGIDFFSKTDAERLRLRPFQLYELPPSNNPDENFPIYLADDYVVNSRSGLAPQGFFAFTTQIIDLTRYDRQDVAWPNATRPAEETIDQFEYYTWRLWSSLAPVQIYTHDGSSNYVLSTPSQRQQVIRDVSGWLNAQRVRHVFMEDLGDYMVARTRSVLTRAEVTNGTLTLTFSGNATTADGEAISTEVLLFQGDTEATPQPVAGFTGGATVTVGVTNPAPTTTGLNPASAAAGGPGFTLGVSGTNFVSGSVVRWNGTARATTYVSATQLTAAIPAADIAAAGTATVTVVTPAPGGGTSNPQTFTITAASNPVPTTTGLNPASVPAGGADFTLTVTGTNFVGSSQVRWNGANRITTFVSATQLTAAIPAADIAAAGTASVTVLTPAPGGGTSNAQTFTITAPNNPVPTTTGLSPASATVGGTGFTLTVTGTSFMSGSVVRWNGADRVTTFVSATQLTAAIPAADVAAAGTASVTVFTPAPGGGTSNAQSFTILAPGGTFFDDFNRADNALLGNGWAEKTPGAFSLTGNGVSKAPTGTGFADNLVYRPASENLLDVEASVDVRFTSLPPGYAQLFVRGQTGTIATAGTFSGYLLFTDNDPGRALLSRIENGAFMPLAQLTINPGLNTTDTFRLRLAATGTDPVVVAASVERFTGTAWSVIAQATVNDTAATRYATAGTVGFTGYGEGGVYTYDNFTRTSLNGGSGNPIPTTSGLVPSSVLAGAPGFTLTVTGSGFVTDSVVRWNGANRPTTFVSATELTAALPAADVGVTGTALVTVFNPAPGGGTANVQYFSILDPTGVFVDTFNRPDSAELRNGWTEKYPAAFAIQNNEVVMIDTGSTDYHDAIAYRPAGEDLRDVEVGLEFRVLPGLSFPQLHARIQRDTIAQANTLDDYLLFVDGFAAPPGRAVIARQAAVPGQFECYMLGIPFPAQLEATARYRLRFRVVGGNPVTLTGFVDRFDGTAWQQFASGSVVHDDSTQPIPGDYCEPGFMPPPITTAGAVGFAKWRTANEVLDNFSWTSAANPNPVPTATGISPATALAGAPGFTLTVTGTNFLTSSVVRWNGAARTTTYVSATQLTGAIPAADVAVAGTAQVTVANPAPGGGTSNPQTFTISAASNPTPTTTGVTPASAVAGAPGFTVTVSGTNFVTDSVVRWNGAARSTTYVSATQLTAMIPAADIAAAGTAEVTVFNPAPGGGVSNPQTFTITNPVPTTTGLSPATAVAGGPGLTLTVTGTNFVAGSVVRWNGAARATTYSSATQLTATIPATDIAAAATAQVTVFNPAPGGGVSSAQTFTITNPVPTTTGLSPATAVAGGPGFTLTVTGTNFVAGSVVQWNGAARATTYSSATQLTATIPATDIAAAATAQVTVFNPAPGGGASSAQTFTITNPVPTTNGLNPAFVTAGAPGFTLTVTGTNFVASSVVRWNGAARATTYVSATQLTVPVSAADVATAGTAQVTVVTPAPGGGTSNTQTFTILNPVPTITSLSPASVVVGGTEFALTVTGTNFVASSVVRWNGADRPTTYVSATQLTATIPATDLLTVGTARVTVFNPPPGGGTSNSMSVVIGGLSGASSLP
ncbi:MAG: beta strand repeat-containing protein [Micromonosporaceae bacterium]